jgi:hypothetical protein
MLLNAARRIYRFLLIAIRTPFIQLFLRTQYKRSSKLGYPVDRLGNPALWMTYPLVDFLSTINFSNSEVFEYGSGGSTLWWASRSKNITSIEYNLEWLDLVKNAAPKNVTIQHHPIDPGYSKTILETNNKFDVIVIDGAHRFSCAKDAPTQLSDKGIIILDNTEWHLNAAKALRDQGFLQIDFAGFCPLNSFPSVSSIFFKASSNLILNNRNEKSIIPLGGKQHPEGVCYDDLN